MHDQRTPAEQDDVADRAIMDLLLDDSGPWAVAELQREFRAPVSALDSLNRLAGVGMVHRLDEFVFATRTAKRAAALFEG
jgi:hypothetical protein